MQKLIGAYAPSVPKQVTLFGINKVHSWVNTSFHKYYFFFTSSLAAREATLIWAFFNNGLADTPPPTTQGLAALPEAAQGLAALPAATQELAGTPAADSGVEEAGGASIFLGKLLPRSTGSPEDITLFNIFKSYYEKLRYWQPDLITILTYVLMDNFCPCLGT